MCLVEVDERKWGVGKSRVAGLTTRRARSLTAQFGQIEYLANIVKKHSLMQNMVKTRGTLFPRKELGPLRWPG